MKNLLLTVGLVALTGCAYMTASTTRTTAVDQFGTTNTVEKTHAVSYSLFDSQESLAKLNVHSGYATNANGSFSPGITAAGVNQNASSTNVVAALNAIANLAQSLAKMYP